MVKETIRMCSNALASDEYGVNFFLSGSSVPLVVVGDETRDNEVALGNPMTPFPSLSVILGEPLELDGEVMTSYRDGIDMTLLIRYMGREVGVAQGVSDMWDTMRATQRCLRQWLSNDNAVDRQLDDVQVIAATGMTVLPNSVGAEDVMIPGGILLRLRVRDIAP